MATPSARHRRAKAYSRCGGLLLVIAGLVFAAASVAWCTPPEGRRVDLHSHGPKVPSGKIDRLPHLMVGNKNGGFQKNYREWQSLTPQEKETLRRRMDQLNRMPPQDRRHLQHLNDRLQQLSPDERGQLQRALDNWNNLSPSEKEAIRRKFGN
ncbi:MAG: DUF3106 domain-containing protein [Deltaproteobacteria bacterium]|nr:DUF3106 domain-containing protein [Deltaproteobacteria bacterium]